MPAYKTLNRQRQSQHGRMVALSRHRPPDDPELLAARREYELARAGDAIERRIDELVAAAPPLTAEQRSKLAALLGRPSASGGGRAA